MLPAIDITQLWGPYCDLELYGYFYDYRSNGCVWIRRGGPVPLDISTRLTMEPESFVQELCTSIVNRLNQQGVHGDKTRSKAALDMAIGASMALQLSNSVYAARVQGVVMLLSIRGFIVAEKLSRGLPV